VEWRGSGLILTYYPGICLDGLRKYAEKKHCRGSRCPGRNFNPGPPIRSRSENHWTTTFGGGGGDCVSLSTVSCLSIHRISTQKIYTWSVQWKLCVCVGGGGGSVHIKFSSNKTLPNFLNTLYKNSTNTKFRSLEIKIYYLTLAYYLIWKMLQKYDRKYLPLNNHKSSAQRTSRLNFCPQNFIW
jgi:hypothetical protein